MGPDLTQLFVGSEGVLGVITAAQLRLHPVAPAEGRRAYGFDGFAEGLEVCRRILRRGATPAVLRLYDGTESTRNFELSGPTRVLVVLDEADQGLLDATLAVVDAECRAAGAAELDVAIVERWMGHRNDVSALAPLYRAGIVVDTIEIAARWSALPRLYDDCVGTLVGIDGTLAASAHQSHAYVRRGLSLLHLRRPQARYARRCHRRARRHGRRRRLGRAVLQRGVGCGHGGGARPTAVPSATTTAWASTGAGSWPTPSAAPSTCSSA